MRVTYDRGARQFAKRRGLALITIDVIDADGNRMTLQSPMDNVIATAIFEAAKKGAAGENTEDDA